MNYLKQMKKYTRGKNTRGKNTRGKNTRGKNTRGKQLMINDVDFSEYKSRGTRATMGIINYHYQRYSNINDFFNAINLHNLSNIHHYIDLMYIDEIKIYPTRIFINKKIDLQFVLLMLFLILIMQIFV